MKPNLYRCFAAALSLSALTAAAPVHAQTYPSKPVRFVAPFVPDGPTGILADRHQGRFRRLIDPTLP